MKTIFLALLWMQQVVYGRPAPEYQPYFSAVVVKDFDTSAAWYQSVFGLKVKTEMILIRPTRLRFWSLQIICWKSLN